MSHRKDYYGILNISKDATQDDVKKAYRRRARETHPDKMGKDKEEEFKQVSEAYQVLSDPIKKRDYDSGKLIIDNKTFFKSPEDIYMEVYGDEEQLMEEFYNSTDPFLTFFKDAEFRHKPDNPFRNKFMNY